MRCLGIGGILALGGGFFGGGVFGEGFVVAFEEFAVFDGEFAGVDLEEVVALAVAEGAPFGVGSGDVFAFGVGLVAEGAFLVLGFEGGAFVGHGHLGGLGHFGLALFGLALLGLTLFFGGGAFECLHGFLEGVFGGGLVLLGGFLLALGHGFGRLLHFLGGLLEGLGGFGGVLLGGFVGLLGVAFEVLLFGGALGEALGLGLFGGLGELLLAFEEVLHPALHFGAGLGLLAVAGLGLLHRGLGLLEGLFRLRLLLGRLLGLILFEGLSGLLHGFLGPIHGLLSFGLTGVLGRLLGSFLEIGLGL